jgi:hypothetical protein
MSATVAVTNTEIICGQRLSMESTAKCLEEPNKLANLTYPLINYPIYLSAASIDVVSQPCSPYLHHVDADQISCQIRIRYIIS